MRKLLPLLAVCSLLGACSTAEKYAANQAAARNWLASVEGRASVRVDGAWQAEEAGWGGDGRLEQAGNRITGALGNYTVRGTVRGSTVYLLFDSGGWTYYTAILKKRGDILGGFYSASIPFSSGDQGALNLRRISD